MLKRGGNVLCSTSRPTTSTSRRWARWRSDRELRRLRGGDQPRPLLPRSPGDAHLAFEGNSHVEWFEGNFDAYEEDKRRRLGDAADRPTRLAYKKLTR
jgi:hypothetical protein